MTTKTHVKKFVFNLIPTSIRSLLITHFKSLTFLAPNKDHRICFDSAFYGKVCFTLNPAYRIERIIMYEHFYDRKTLLYIKRLIRKGDIIVDIGANIGSMTIPLAYHAGPSGKVFAFEPGPIFFDRLAENIIENPQLSDCVECINLGLSEATGFMYYNRRNAVLSNRKNGLKVSVTTLDEFLKNKLSQKLDFIKIDVEGMELEVIRGALDIINNFKPIILLETLVKKDTHGKIKRILNLLRNFSYEFFEIDIPEAQLTNDPQEFNFIPTYYPDLPCDTLAIPPKYNYRLQ